MRKLTSSQGADHGSAHIERLRLGPDVQVRRESFLWGQLLTEVLATSRESSAVSWDASSACWHGTSVRIRLPRAAWRVSHRATGSAKGNGNPYGIAAINAVFLLPLVFLRLFAPPQYLGGVLLLGVSNFFYSRACEFADSHSRLLMRSLLDSRGSMVISLSLVTLVLAGTLLGSDSSLS